jgi:hypothetical protein
MPTEQEADFAPLIWSLLEVGSVTQLAPESVWMAGRTYSPPWAYCPPGGMPEWVMMTSG